MEHREELTVAGTHQRSLLTSLALQGGSSAWPVPELALLSPSARAHVLARLVARGYVTRSGPGGRWNRRTYRVELTPLGWREATDLEALAG